MRVLATGIITASGDTITAAAVADGTADLDDSSPLSALASVPPTPATPSALFAKRLATQLLFHLLAIAATQADKDANAAAAETLGADNMLSSSSRHQLSLASALNGRTHRMASSLMTDQPHLTRSESVVSAQSARSLTPSAAAELSALQEELIAEDRRRRREEGESVSGDDDEFDLDDNDLDISEDRSVSRSSSTQGPTISRPPTADLHAAAARWAQRSTSASSFRLDSARHTKTAPVASPALSDTNPFNSTSDGMRNLGVEVDRVSAMVAQARQIAGEVPRLVKRVDEFGPDPALLEFRSKAYRRKIAMRERLEEQRRQASDPKSWPQVFQFFT
jgi:hypothetical protein